MAQDASCLSTGTPLDYEQMNPFVYFSGPRKQGIEQLVSFLRQGAFEVVQRLVGDPSLLWSGVIETVDEPFQFRP